MASILKKQVIKNGKETITDCDIWDLVDFFEENPQAYKLLSTELVFREKVRREEEKKLFA